MDDNLFKKNLLEKNKDLVEISVRKKYTLLIPLSKYITPNMLVRNFYDNHTFYQCEYDPKMYINLNGKVLELKNNQFHTFLGFKRSMTFNSIEEVIWEISTNGSLKVIIIDNVIDETVYNQSNTSTGSIIKKEIIKRYNNKEDYVKYFSNLTKAQDELKEVDQTLKELIEKLQNNYILIKGHVHTYYKYFQELVNDFNNYLLSKLFKYKIDDNFSVIVYELTESLVFNKMFQFLFLNIKQFNLDEEADLKNKISNLKSDFSFTTHKLDSVFNECKFKQAINELKKISSLTTPFEKIAVLIYVNSLIDKEAKECVEKNSFRKKNFTLTADEMIPMWQFVVINSDIPNLLTECCIMNDFSLKGSYSENDYIVATLIQAVEQIKKEGGSSFGTSTKYSNITPIFIQTKTIIPEAQNDFYSNRSQSMATSSSKSNSSAINRENEAGLFGSVTSSIKKIFNN